MAKCETFTRGLPSVSQRGNAIDHHERRAHDSGFDGGSAAGYDSGAGMVEGGERSGTRWIVPTWGDGASRFETKL